jgi:hypothetical protein|nr:MAG TPA: Lysozyme [Caudoviricetes sp.]
MAKVEILAPYIKKWEGGFVNDPADRGGATNKGITIATFEAYCKAKSLPRPNVERLKRMTDGEWLDILKTMFWDRWQADKIKSQKLANILVDWVWGSGVYGIKIPQRILGVKQDGIVGNKTLEALNAQDPDKLFQVIYEARKKYLNDITISRPANKRFLRGWLNRLEDIRRLS